jgi:hypothetical protein
MTDTRAVSTAIGVKKAEAMGIGFIETSAKNATNVDLAFEKLVTEIFHRHKQVPDLLPPKSPMLG